MTETAQPVEYYRYVDDHYDSTGTRVVRQTLVLHKKTERGAWIKWPWDHDGTWKKFVLDGDGKRWAYPDVDKALRSFEIRKTRQIQRCKATIERAQAALEIVRSADFDKTDDGYVSLQNLFGDNPFELVDLEGDFR